MRKGRTGTLVQQWRVPLGFLTAAIFLLLARPTWASLAAGGVVALVGLAVRAWASGHIRKNQTLAVSGPYAHTRNPLYFGSFLLGLGFTIAAGRWWLGVLFAVFYLGVYLPVMRVEANTMQTLFAAEYQRYARNVPLFIPRLIGYRGAGAEAAFDSKLYLRYREYRAALGSAAAWALLALQTVFLPDGFAGLFIR